MIIFTGIGSRKTPDEVLIIMGKLAQVFAKKGWILRSGHAPGADKAFEKGCDKAGGSKEIYIPWKGFEGSTSDLYEGFSHLAEEYAFQYHPNLYACTPGAVKLMIRNTCQILGKNCKTKSDLVVCYCEIDKNGKWKGGTGQALRIAQAYKIPIFNLYYKEDLDKLKEFVRILDDPLVKINNV